MRQFSSPPERVPLGRLTSAETALVVVLHSWGDVEAAHALTAAWAPTVPAAAISMLRVADGGDIGEIAAQLAHRVEQAGLQAGRMVLAGFGGAAGMTLQLAVGQGASGRGPLACAGVLACGDVLPPLALLARRSVTQARLRLIWAADDPLFCAAALGDLLRCCRAAGVDAQGAVLARHGGASGGDHDGPAPALVRLGAAYLAELVATALDAPPGR